MLKLSAVFFPFITPFPLRWPGGEGDQEPLNACVPRQELDQARP